jgi:hypothetical protein
MGRRAQRITAGSLIAGAEMTNSQGPDGPYSKALAADRNGEAVSARALLHEAVAAGDATAASSTP